MKKICFPNIKAAADNVMKEYLHILIAILIPVVKGSQGFSRLKP